MHQHDIYELEYSKQQLIGELKEAKRVISSLRCEKFMLREQLKIEQEACLETADLTLTNEPNQESLTKVWQIKHQKEIELFQHQAQDALDQAYKSHKIAFELELKRLEVQHRSEIKEYEHRIREARRESGGLENRVMVELARKEINLMRCRRSESLRKLSLIYSSQERKQVHCAWWRWKSQSSVKVELAIEKLRHIVLRRETKAKSRAFRQWTSNDFKQEIERLYRELGNAKADAWKYKRQLLGGQY